MMFSLQKFAAFFLFNAVKWLIYCCSAVSSKKRRSHYDVVIYKVDRLGDWVLGRAALRECLDRAEGRCLLIVATILADTARTDFPNVDILALDFEGEGLSMILRNLRQLIRIACRIETGLLVSFRHNVGPLREIALASISAQKKIVANCVTANVKRAYPWLRAEVGSGIVISKALIEKRELCHELRRHAGVLGKMFGLEAIETRPRLANAASIPYYVVIAPFASVDIKNYPDSGWTELVKQIADEHPLVRFELWLGGSQIPHGLALSKAMSKEIGAPVEVKTASGLLDLQDAVGKASLVLTVDTAVAHIAAAFDKPSIIIMGGGLFGEYGPWQWSHKQRWITNELACFGCDLNCIHDKPLCLTEISPARLAFAACELLQQSSVAACN
jgi:Glycosyltransferase family 9 (heptosyltransferase)